MDDVYAECKCCYMPSRPAFPKRDQYQPSFIKEWRDHRQLTQEKLAERVGVSVPTISRVETGKSPYNQPLMEAIAEALQCSVSDLIARKPGVAVHESIRLVESLPDSLKDRVVQMIRAAFGSAA